MRAIRITGVMGLLFLAVACAGDDFTNGNENNPVDPGPAENRVRDTSLFLTFYYWNPNSVEPTVAIIPEESTVPLVDTLGWRRRASVSPFAEIVFENVALPAGLMDIRRIQTQEWNDTTWKNTSEFTAEWEDVTRLLVVLVMDISRSLGSNFPTVLQFASAFADTVKARTGSAEIGIVAFGSNIQVQPLTGDTAAVRQFLSRLRMEDFTKLYEGMFAGIDLLANERADAKYLVTFTDGNDNFSDPAITPSLLRQRLDQPDDDNRKIRSFIIGFQGSDGVDRQVLSQLASEDSLAVYPKDVIELGEVFQKFSRQVSTVFNIIYRRSRQVIPEAQKKKFRLVIDITERI